ncbi:MAG TPA: hypothetical protein VM621_10585 [Luteibacter sp.]|uniref:hypothetical protein n=1 Tax=Luteibacter sp. TaxID=1886636 RepID=UPI002C08E823|nr:hypothetical protein [Luteibacter sp.]HVI55483.1 hypothetical protein [Luteibacter sp.]
MQKAADEATDDSAKDTDKTNEDESWKAKKVKVSIQGEEHEITLEEAINGYQRQQDYTRKTQEAAELTRAAQAERAQVKQELESRVNSLNVLGAALYQEYVGDQAKLAGLLETDPHGYLRVKEQMAQRQALLGQIEAHRQATQEYAINEQAKARAESLRLAEETLLDRLPEWKDPGKRKAESTDIANALVDAGYTHDELKELIDPRALIVARKAALWDKAQAAKAKATEVTKPPAIPAKPVKPGTAGKPEKSAGAMKAADNYRRNPNSLDALAGFALERGI